MPMSEKQRSAILVEIKNRPKTGGTAKIEVVDTNDEELERQVVEQLRSGKTIREIKAMFKIGSSRAENIRKKYHIRFNHRNRESKDAFLVRYEEGKRMIAAGATRKEVQAATRLSDKSIQKIRKELEGDTDY